MSKSIVIAGFVLLILVVLGSGSWSKSPPLSLTVLEPGSDPNQTVFELRNTSLGFVSYQGYGLLPFGADPIYGIEEREGPDWKPKMYGICGTGLKTQILPPGMSVTFTARSPEVPSRVVVRAKSGFFMTMDNSVHGPEFAKSGT